MSLTLEQAADFLKLHPNTVQQRAKRGEIPGAAKPGKRWVFLEDGLREYVYSLSPCRYEKSGTITTSTSQAKTGGLERALGLPTEGRPKHF
jgi:excisionase family DNA binding protein